jgi:enoyl-CoA hydratase
MATARASAAIAVSGASSIEYYFILCATVAPVAEELVLYRVEDGVATVTLNDPEKRNRLSGEMLAGLVDAMRRARDDEEARAVVLTGAGKAFCAGADLGGFGSDAPPIQKHFGTDLFLEFFRLMPRLGKPTLCAANGHVVAGGLGLALSCDLVIAKRGADFWTPEINIGAFPYMIMSIIYRNVPRKVVNEMILLGERLSAEDAVRHGLANKVVPEDEFDAAVADWAGKLASKSPVLMRLGHDAMYRQQDMALDDALEYLRSQLSLTFSTEDIVEGAQAFFEKREPNWKGR